MPSALIIAPHPDDAELGMGGTIVRLSRQGHKVHIVDMTNGEPTPHGSVETRAKESTAAAKIMGVERTLLGLPNRQVVHTVEARHKLAAVVRVHRPDWMFVPYPVDAHPDHVAVTKIAEDARFDAKLTKTDIPGQPWHPKRIIYYFCTHLRTNFPATFCIDITEQLQTKLAACAVYESQFGSHTAANFVPDMVKTINGYFGSRIGTPYAEPFFTHETLGFGGLDQLI